MKTSWTVALGLALVCALPAWPADLAAGPVPSVGHVVIISVDGLRPDCLLRADAPVLRELVREGAGTFWGRTVDAGVTLPSHASMLTGVSPRRHGIEWNGNPPAGAPRHPLVPTIFERATMAGRTCALIAGKAKFETLAAPGTVTFARIFGGADGTDANVAAAAVAIIREHRPDLVFIHFPGADTAGHAHGWGSPEQLAAIAAIDGRIGAVLDALREAGLRDNTVVIVTADHGGAGLSHGPGDPRSLYIPWIINGPGVRPGFDLTRLEKRTVITEDTCATACWLLGLGSPADFDGRAVTEAFASGG